MEIQPAAGEKILAILDPSKRDLQGENATETVLDLLIPGLEGGFSGGVSKLSSDLDPHFMTPP